MNQWNDYNDAEQQQSFDLIPKGTLVKVRMTIKPGGHDNPARGWTGGYATESFDTGSIYLNCEFVVLEGEYAKRKLWSLIGLHSPKGEAWGNMGRSFIRAVLNSAMNVHPQDNSPPAQAARRIQDFSALDGIVFVARVDIEKDAKGEDKNVVKQVIEPDQKDYARIMGVVSKATPGGGFPGMPPTQSTPSAPASPAQKPAIPAKPSWAS